MKTRRIIPVLMIVFALVLSACSAGIAVTGNQETDAMAESTETMMDDEKDMSADSMEKDDMSAEDQMKDESMSDDHSDDMMEDESMSEDKHMDDDSMSEDKSMDEGAMMDSPAWFTTEFVNVNTGETFTIADYKGKVVLVETLATWCSNCLRQQKEVKALHEMLGESDLVSIGLDIDLYEDADILRNYVQNQGFDWIYTVATAEVAREIGDLYGAQFLNPPSTPILIIDREGKAHPLPFGIKSAEELKEAIQPFLDSSM